MIPLQRILPQAIIDIVRRQPTTPAKIEFAWRTAVGPAVARASSVSLEADGTLLIHAADERWQREIEPSIPLVRSRLEVLLGNVLTRVAFAARRA